jgi:flavin reductase (DIM6/NTAB) family NADH-FMN oxidoreductase RutF
MGAGWRWGRGMKRSLGARTLVFPTPVWVIGSYDAHGRANLMTASWAGVCCSKPPCVAVSLRKATYTHGCITARQAFTVNVPAAEQVAIADYLGTASGRNVDKVAACGLTPVPSGLVDAPYVAEVAMVLECRVLRTVEIGSHTQFIGEIVDVKVDEGALAENGLPAMENIRPLVYAPELRRYYAVGGVVTEAFKAAATVARK